MADVADQQRLYVRLVGAQIRSQWQYRTSFLLFLLAQAIVTAFELIAIILLFDVVDDLGGWTAAEVVLLYGLANLAFAVTDLVVSPVENLAVHVRTGTFDRLLLRPLSPLVQICALEFELRRLGKLVPTTAALAWALVSVDVAWDGRAVGILMIGFVSGVAIYSAIFVATASLSFWIVDAREAANAATYGGNTANEYPMHVYPGWVRAILGWAIPVAFVAYVPVVTVLDAPNPLGVPPWLVTGGPVVAVVSVALALATWRTGVRRYQGTGS